MSEDLKKMSSPKLNQGFELNDIVNKRNKWLFTSIEISEYLTYWKIIVSIKKLYQR